MTPMVHKEIEIEAPAEQVWAYVGTQAGLQQWWGAQIFLEEAEGGRCEERGALDGVPYHRVGKVTIYDPPRQLHLTFQAVTAQTWPAYTTISLTLSEAGQRTLVTVVQQVHDLPHGMPDATPSDAMRPQSEVYPPVLQMAREWPAAPTDASGYVSPPMRGDRGAVPGALGHYEQVWGERLEALKRKSQSE